MDIIIIYGLVFLFIVILFVPWQTVPTKLTLPFSASKKTVMTAQEIVEMLQANRVENVAIEEKHMTWWEERFHRELGPPYKPIKQLPKPKATIINPTQYDYGKKEPLEGFYRIIDDDASKMLRKGIETSIERNL